MDTITANRMRSLITDTLGEIDAHRAEWEALYRKYIDCIKRYETKQLDDSLKQFLSSSKLTLHSSIGRAEQDADTEQDLMELDLRFAGQSVASIKQETETVIWTAKENISDYFNNSPTFPSNRLLNSAEEKQFIRFFEEEAKESDVRTQKNRIVEELLKEFRKEQGANKALLYIQPVLLNGMFFSMPVPFTIQGDGVGYTTGRAGHIDIFARRWPGVRGHRCIMSVIPDEENTDYPLAAERALKYAVFIAALLRSDSLGYDWWNFIRNQEEDKDVPENLHIDVVVAVPQGQQGLDHFQGEKIPLDELKCTFHCHTLYYDTQALLDGMLTGFRGSYAN